MLLIINSDFSSSYFFHISSYKFRTLPGHEVGAVAFGLPIIFDVVDTVDTRGQGAVATVCVEVFVKVTYGNVGISL